MTFRPARPAPLVTISLEILVNLAAVTFFLLSYTRHGISFGPYRIDLDVYRLGGRAWLRQRDLYGALLTTSSGSRLPFTYPPVATVLMSPLALLPMTVASTVVTLTTIALTALVLWFFLRYTAGQTAGQTARQTARQKAGSWRMAGWLLPAVLFLEPVRNTINYGQVNVALMALVTVDCLVPAPRWQRGALTGLAAAVKLEPAAFVLYFLLRGDRRAAGTAVGSFAACTAAGFVVATADSARYWTLTIFQIGRPDFAAYTANQSILAVLARAGLGPRTPAATAVWLALSAVVVLLAVRGMRRALARSQHTWALTLNSFAILLISPISWSHHWVWAEPGLIVMAILGWRYRKAVWLGTAATGILVLAIAPQCLLPPGGYGWSVWQQVIGSSYTILAVAVLVVASWGDASAYSPAVPEMERRESLVRVADQASVD